MGERVPWFYAFTVCPGDATRYDLVLGYEPSRRDAPWFIGITNIGQRCTWINLFPDADGNPEAPHAEYVLSQIAEKPGLRALDRLVRRVPRRQCAARSARCCDRWCSAMSTDTSTWGPAEWEGRARMAAARAFSRVALDAIDRDALRRHPEHAEGLGEVVVIGEDLQPWKSSAERVGGYQPRR